MRILVTGASGFIGGAVIARLGNCHEVVAVDRGGAPLGPCRYIRADLADPFDPGSWPSRIDAVIHLAHERGGFPDMADKAFSSDTVATFRLLEYARRAGAACFLYASTGSVYGPGTVPFREEDPPDPASFYAVVKYASELLLRPYRAYFNTCLLRIFVPYGPGQKDRMIPSILSRVVERERVLLVNGGQPRSNPIFVDDLAEAVAMLLDAKGHNVLNIGGPGVHGIREIAETAGRILGVKPLYEERNEPGRFDLVGDISRLRSLLPELRLRGLEEGLRLTLAPRVRTV